jgi:hypothetical protein
MQNQIKDYGCTVTIYGRQKIWISIVLLTTTALHEGQKLIIPNVVYLLS